VIQEALLCPITKLVLGRLTVTWDSFIYAKEKLLIGQRETEVPAVLQLDSNIVRNGGVNLPDLLIATNSCDATDPTDKVFGLLSLAQIIDRSSIPVDYTISCKEVFTIATEHCINHYGPSILSMIQYQTSSQLSGVPNYISTGQPVELTPIQFTKENFPFQDFRLAFCVSQNGDQMALRVNDKFLDFVKRIQSKTDQAFAQLEKCNRYLVNPAPLKEVAGGLRQMFGIDTSPDETPLSFFLHKPEEERQMQELLQPGVDPEDLTAIDLLAPWYEEVEEGPYFPYCTCLLANFVQLAGQFLEGRYAFYGKHTIGVCPRGTKIGDRICKAEGLNTPLVLRRCQSTENYVIVGPCQIIIPSNREHTNCKSRRYHLELPANWVDIEKRTTLYDGINIV
jgi:hypothetical protein